MGLETALQSHSIWRGDGPAKVAAPSIATGFSALDPLLPGGGWPTSALTELLLAHRGIGELRLLMPALSHLTQAQRHIAFIAPPYIPYAPALVAAGVALPYVLVVRAAHGNEALWAAEQCLRAGVCGAVLTWPHTHDDRPLRRLQVAAESGRSWGIMLRPARAAAQPSPAPLRIALTPAMDGITLRILKRRGAGMPAPLTLRFDTQANPSSHNVVREKQEAFCLRGEDSQQPMAEIPGAFAQPITDST